MASKRVNSSLEDYIEAIYTLSLKTDNIKSVDVARLLDVSKASVSNAMDRLVNIGYITKSPYGSINITQLGIEKAKEIYKRHTLLKSFLINVLGVNDETAEVDACKMEHQISDETFKKLERYIQKLNLFN
ncbi:TPA: metal-dependent transcriptional regulator [bacterium]|nr:metal-dependent transcriptional regulator [bacterium]